ncbi:MAG: choice-of-anchor K domain-containing protein [Gammaproteobacteria bacterium]
MKKINKFTCGLLCAGALSVSSFANASVVKFSGLTASWINIDPVAISVSGNGTDTASMAWGTPLLTQGPQSDYVFETASTPFQVELPPSPSAAFDLGTWTFNNNPLSPNTDIVNDILRSATLQLDTTIEVDGTSVGTKSFFFDFTHIETPNNDDPCANGDANNVDNNINGCADIVTVAANSLSESFLLELDPRNVSEPGTLALLGLGLAGLGVRLRRKSA